MEEKKEGFRATANLVEEGGTPHFIATIITVLVLGSEHDGPQRAHKNHLTIYSIAH